MQMSQRYSLSMQKVQLRPFVIMTSTSEVDEHVPSRRRKKLADDQQLKCRYLNKDAVPTVFMNVGLPSYLTSHGATPHATRQLVASASSRRQQNKKKLETLQKAFEAGVVNVSAE